MLLFISDDVSERIGTETRRRRSIQQWWRARTADEFVVSWRRRTTTTRASFGFRSEGEYLIVWTSLTWLSSKRKCRDGWNSATAGKKKGNSQRIIMKKPKKKTKEGIFQTCLAHFHYFQKKRFRMIYGINNLVDSKLSTTHHMLQIPWQLTMMSQVEMPQVHLPK
jgi:hypothetical protein